jgi:hypothetical protein
VTGCQFEYGTSEAYGLSAPCSPSPGAEASPVAVSASLAGLTPNTTYYYRIVASNAGGTSYGSGQTFSTPVNPPTVAAGAPSSLGQVSTTLNGTVNPNEGAVSECQFEYGSSEAYGASVACSPSPGAGAGPIAVSAPLTGLSPGTTYHFRLVATNPGGTSYGADTTFETASPMLPELGRCLPSEGETGRYKTAACTTKSSGEDSGRYEWQPWPAVNDDFASDGGAVSFETVHKSTIRCATNTLAGEYRSSQTVVAGITFVGCEAPGALGGKCQSEGAQAGEIRTGSLEGELGVIKAGTKPTIGWDLKPASGPLATIKCGEFTLSVTGSVIAPIKPVNKMTTVFTLKFKAAKGKQKPEAFAASNQDTLSFVTSSAEEQAGLTMTAPISNSEALEIKSIA